MGFRVLFKSERWQVLNRFSSNEPVFLLNIHQRMSKRSCALTHHKFLCWKELPICAWSGSGMLFPANRSSVRVWFLSSIPSKAMAPLAPISFHIKSVLALAFHSVSEPWTIWRSNSSHCSHVHDSMYGSRGVHFILCLRTTCVHDPS